MATLCIGEVDCSTPLLRDWLAGDWALLFSHPVDFQDQGLEHDRWLDILRDEFRARGVKPIACRRPAGSGCGCACAWQPEKKKAAAAACIAMPESRSFTPSTVPPAARRC